MTSHPSQTECDLGQEFTQELTRTDFTASARPTIVKGAASKRYSLWANNRICLSFSKT